MKKDIALIAVLGILFLLFIQLAGTLVESIYMMDLLHSGLDEKVLGVLFFFTPVLILPLYRKSPRGLLWAMFGLLLLSRGFLPYLNVAPRMLVSGLGVLAVVSLFFLLLRVLPQGEPRQRIGLYGGAALALAIGLSVLTRTAYHGVEYSLVPAGGWVGWLLGLLLGFALTQLKLGAAPAPVEKKIAGLNSTVIGIFLLLILSWFAFSAPSVIARWTQGDYTLIVAAVSLFSAGWVVLTLLAPGWPEKVNSRLLLVWNIVFTVCLTVTLLTQQVAVPLTPTSAPVVVGAAGFLQLASLGLTLLLFPVIFLDMKIFLDPFRENIPAPRDLVPGILLASLLLIVLVFANIFTNVWGYVKPISLFFRGKFWLSYFLIAGLITLLMWLVNRKNGTALPVVSNKFHWAWAMPVVVLFLVTVKFALPVEKFALVTQEMELSTIKVMTYNIQQANDAEGEKSFERQLALIQKANPDVLALQETDSTRVSLNNNDYLRFYADSLGYYSYFGPTTVMGTYGTAILSRFPLENMRTAYVYSDKDENGIAEAEVNINGQTFTIYNVHPDGSETVDLIFAQSLILRSKGKPFVIAMGDYNLRDYEGAYHLIDRVYTNVWTSIYPTKISDDGVDMSGKNRIDHIFISSDLKARNPVYVLIPESATDHAVHWTELYWAE